MSIEEGSVGKSSLLNECEDIGEHQWPAEGVSVIDGK